MAQGLGSTGSGYPEYAEDNSDNRYIYPTRDATTLASGKALGVPFWAGGLQYVYELGGTAGDDVSVSDVSAFGIWAFDSLDDVPAHVVANQYIIAAGLSYKVAASGATDHDEVTLSGVKLYGIAAVNSEELDTAVTAAESAQAGAEAAETAAETHAANALTYSNSALTLSDIYDDTTAGLAAVAEGEFFGVKPSTPDGAVKVYQDLSGVATYVFDFISQAFVTGRIKALAALNPEIYTLNLDKTMYFYSANVRWSLFSDDAATTQSQVGDRVAVMLDLSGNGNHAVQTVDLKRPILRRDWRGFYYLEFDASVEERLLSIPNGADSASVTAFGVARCQTQTGTDQYLLNAYNGGGAGWVLAQDNGCKFTLYSANPPVALAQTATGSSAPEINFIGEVAYFEGGYSAGSGRGYAGLNGHIGTETLTPMVAGAASDIVIGRNNVNTAGDSTIHIYALAVAEEYLERKDRDTINKWLQKQAPLDGRQVNALSALKSKLDTTSDNVGVLHISDSLGDHRAEWFERWANDFAGLYPDITVDFERGGDGVISETVRVQTGASGRTLTFRNLAASGQIGSLWMADRFGLISGMTDCDLVIFNVGKNQDDSAGQPAIVGEYVALMDQILSVHPDAAIAYIMQPRNLLDDEEVAKHTALKTIFEGNPAIELLDFDSMFVGFNASEYEDRDGNAIHPALADPFTGSGSQIGADYLMKRYGQASVLPPTATPAFTDTAGTNIITNGDFAVFTGDVPDGFVESTSGVASADTSIKDIGQTKSLKVAGAGAYVSYTLDAGELAALGSALSVFVRVRPTEGEANSGLVEVITNLGSDDVTLTGNPGDAFMHRMLSGIDTAGVTSVEIRLYGSASGANFNDLMVTGTDFPRAFSS